MRPKSKVSQSRIAEELGLSQGVVSRILNGNRRHIANETYARVWQHALAIGYQGKGINLRVRHESTELRHVGLILRAGMQVSTHSNYFSHVQAGLQSVLATYRVGLVMLGAEDTIDLAQPPPLPSRVVVFGDPRPDFVGQLRRMVQRVVAVSATRPGLCHTVGANEQRSLDLLVAHLRELGHERIGWIGGEPAYSRHRERLEAFTNALALQSLPAARAEDVVVSATGARQVDGRTAILKLMGRRAAANRPTAVIAYNGTMARGAIGALLQDGWKIPEELSIAAVDVTRVCTDDEPAITGASAPPEKLGEEAARMLLFDQIPTGEENLWHVEVSPQLQGGASTAKLRNRAARPT